MRIEYILCVVDRLVLRFWMIALCTSLLWPQLRVNAQGCTAYNQCPALQGETNRKLNSPIIFSFNEQSLTQRFPTQAARDEFKAKIQAAATDWAQKTGTTITLAQPGQTANVTVQVDPSVDAQGNPTQTGVDNGYVNFDPPSDSSSNKRILGFSDEWTTWSSAGRARLASHEWGHILGLKDVPPVGEGSCTGVVSIMTQLLPGGLADAQLRNGYDADPRLPQPPAPNSCDEAKAETLQPTPTPTPPPDGGGGGGSCPNVNCNEGSGFPSDTCAYGTAGCPTGYYDAGGCCQAISITPVLIDVDGSGFSMSEASNGVAFDFYGNHNKLQLSWTAEGSTNAWLVLDRDNNGSIDSGRELFGNITPQSDQRSPDANGFLALAEYDKVENGGNGDGVINATDIVFSKLQLWQDLNHNGVSEPGELHSLSRFDIAVLELHYYESKKSDDYGNQFRYRAKVNNSKGNRPGRWAWDVFLIRVP